MADAPQYSVHGPQVKHIRRFLSELVAPRQTPKSAAAGVAVSKGGLALRPQGIDGQALRTSPPRSAPDWLKDRAVQGIGVGEKMKAGVPQGRTALRVYVNRKRDLADLANPVPPLVETVAAGALETDVVAIGDVRPQAATDRLRPIQPGCSLGHYGVPGGTLGGIVRKAGGGDARYILSNAHVLAAAGTAKAGDEIVQPAIADGGRSGTDRIATLSEFIPFDYASEGFPNEVDAALAEIDRPAIGFRLSFLESRLTPAKVGKRLRVGMKVQKTGRSSGHSWGEIIDTDFHAIVPYDDPRNPGAEVQVLFRDQVLCTRFTEAGDSGALVLSSSGAVVGLHFAGSDEVSVFNRISRVFAALDIELDR